jgi:hypothetical protein
MPGSKRAFERAGLFLSDESIDPISGLPRKEFLSPPQQTQSPEFQLAALQLLASSDTARHAHALFALAWDTSPGTVKALLNAASSGSEAAALQLVRFADDPRVIPALLAGIGKTASSAEVAGFAEAIGRLGAREGIPLLERVQATLESDPTLRAQAKVINAATRALTKVLGALLRLGHEPTRQVSLLQGLLHHPLEANRVAAASELAESLTAMPAAIQSSVVPTLEVLATTGNTVMFSAVAPGLLRLRPDEVLAHCEEMLLGKPLERATAVGILVRSGSQRARALLLKHLPNEQDHRRAAEIATELGSTVPSEVLTRITLLCFGDPSPVTRWMGLSLLERLDRSPARELARTALEEEPDGLIREALGRFLGL